jgi:hypothetical protein
MPSKFFPNTITECLFVLTVTFAFAQSTIFSGMATVMTDVIGRDLNMQGDVVWITSAALYVVPPDPPPSMFQLNTEEYLILIGVVWMR